MIVVRLIGGLGNQMFQYAAARSLADRLGVELLLDLRAFSTYVLHGYALERFRIRGERATPEVLREFPEWRRRLSPLLNKIGVKGKYYTEPKFGYDPRWTSLGDGLHISGYFQSENYFGSIRKALCDDFFPRKALSQTIAQIAESARACESVAVHVRRGDYVSDAKTLKIHGVCSADYYQSAILHLRKEVRIPRFFVFSNDMSWARENLALGEGAVFVDGNSSDPEMDIYLMAQCRHHIIANSSFSWWGAWLADHPMQRVITPTPWFNSRELSSADLVPARWVSLRK